MDLATQRYLILGDIPQRIQKVRILEWGKFVVHPRDERIALMSAIGVEALKDMIVSLVWTGTGWTAVIKSRFAGVQAVTSGQFFPSKLVKEFAGSGIS